MKQILILIILIAGLMYWYAHTRDEQMSNLMAVNCPIGNIVYAGNNFSCE